MLHWELRITELEDFKRTMYFQFTFFITYTTGFKKTWQNIIKIGKEKLTNCVNIKIDANTLNEKFINLCTYDRN